MTIVLDRPATAPEVAPTAAESLEIIVTLEDIRQGERDDEYACAFGLALRRAGYPKAWVGYEDVRPQGYDVWVDGEIYDHTPESEAWVRAFDRELPVAPERFILHRREEPA